DYTLTIVNTTTTATSLGAWSLDLTDSGCPTARFYPPSAIADGVVLDLSQLASTTAIIGTITLTGPDGTVTTVATLSPQTFVAAQPPAPIGPNATVTQTLTIPAASLANPSATLAGLTLNLSQLNF